MSDSSCSCQYVGVAEWGGWREYSTVSPRTVPWHHIPQETLPAAVWRMWNGKQHFVLYFSLLFVISSHGWYNTTNLLHIGWNLEGAYCLTVNTITWSFCPIDKFWTTSQYILFIVSDKFDYWCMLAWSNHTNWERSFVNLKACIINLPT